MMSDRQKPDLEAVKRKIRALLAVAADGSGATPAERDTARTLANVMMAKFFLTEGQVMDGAPPVDRTPRRRVDPEDLFRQAEGWIRQGPAWFDNSTTTGTTTSSWSGGTVFVHMNPGTSSG